MNLTRRRRSVAALLIMAVLSLLVWLNPENYGPTVTPPSQPNTDHDTVLLSDARAALGQLAVKGRAPKTGYTRGQFGDGWASYAGCDMRNRILARDLDEVRTDVNCRVVSGTLHDPYSGQTILFVRGPSSSERVQIDHVVALSDAWQKGAQQLTARQRMDLANDPLNLLAVDGAANQAKADSDAASWLPPQRAFRCQYVARQIAVKQKYALWVTSAEHDAMLSQLQRCPGQQLPTPQQPGSAATIRS